MSPLRTFAVFLLLLAFAGCGTVDQATRAQREQARAQQVVQALNDRHYTIDVNYMHSLRGPGNRYVQGYSLQVKGDTLISYLPYFGDVWRTTSYGTQQGLNFTAPISAYSARQVGRDKVQVVLETESKEDRYQYQLTIFTNGRADIQVLGQNRDGIGFSGEMR